MKNLLFSLTMLLMLGFAAHAQALAQSAESGQMMRVATRPGVTVPLYAVWNKNAVASLVLFSGSNGGFGKPGPDGWPSSKNFLIRTGKAWAIHAFNVVMVGRPSDNIDLGDGRVRIGREHAADNAAIYKTIKQKSALPLWVVGTSMGTISTAASAIQDSHSLISGIVLTSSVTSAKRSGALPTQDLAKIRVPTLIVHHKYDACPICKPSEVKQIEQGLTNTPIHKTIMFSGGSGPSGDSCGAQHHHGFIGAEQQVVDLISAWILSPSS
jgi:pimeloyl-ACP methyl ester carboxylesterase